MSDSYLFYSGPLFISDGVHAKQAPVNQATQPGPLSTGGGYLLYMGGCHLAKRRRLELLVSSGFDNLCGNMELWDLKTHQMICNPPAADLDMTYFEGCPDCQHLP